MSAPIHKLRHRISHSPLLGLFAGREHVVKPAGVSDTVALDQVAVLFKECEAVCAPTADQIEAKERERAERFKGDQLLPIMGICGSWPGPTCG
jgi:hypothetical protein